MITLTLSSPFLLATNLRTWQIYRYSKDEKKVNWTERKQRQRSEKMRMKKKESFSKTILKITAQFIFNHYFTLTLWNWCANEIRCLLILILLCVYVFFSFSLSLSLSVFFLQISLVWVVPVRTTCIPVKYLPQKSESAICGYTLILIISIEYINANEY